MFRFCRDFEGKLKLETGHRPLSFFGRAARQALSNVLAGKARSRKSALPGSNDR